MTDAVLRAAPTRPLALTHRRLDRIAGFSGLTFAVVVAATNLFLGAMSPPRGDATASEIATFVADNRTGLALAVGVVPLAAIALFVFIASAYQRLSRGSEAAAVWARFGMVGLAMVEVFFLSGIVFEATLVADAERLAEQELLTQTLWKLREAATIVSGLFLGVTMVGLSRAGRLTGLIPAWQEILGRAAACAFVVGAVAIVPALDGSPIALLGFAGFIGWLVWLALTSVRLLRSSGEAS